MERSAAEAHPTGDFFIKKSPKDVDLLKAPHGSSGPQGSGAGLNTLRETPAPDT